jgi:tight adherence protein C
MELIYYAGIALTSFCIMALILTPILMRPSRVETRLLGMVHNEGLDERRPGGKERLEERILSVAKRLKTMVGLSEDAVLRARLASAGISSSEGADMYSAARLISPLAGVLVASFLPVSTLTSILIGGGLGYLAPDMWLRKKIKRRRERLRKGVPDMVDLLVICMDAGLGLDQALLRVGQELGFTHPDINQEIVQLTLEQRAGKPRMEAWQSMADRTQIEDIASFVNMLVQTDRFGTPILAALNRLSNDIRLKRRQHAEEMAAKTKIKILFPLVLFIFPCIFIVLLAPALLSIANTLGSLSK